jgi:F0F1-type ATP synthase membrane subunit b/b'
MLTGSELSTAISAILIAAICVGVLLHWLWSRLNRARSSDSARLAEMAERLYQADLAREEAEAARQRAELRLAERETETTEQLAAMQARLDGAVEGREAALAAELADARRDLEAMDSGLRGARQQVIELEAELEALRSGG